MPIVYNGGVTFYGRWSLTVIGLDASFKERVRIAGSLASDGPVAGVVGTTVSAIDGSSWQAFMEWSSDGGATWNPSRIHRNPGVDPTNGFIINLNADDNTPALGDGDFNDLIVEFRYLNPEINPPAPVPPPYSFTLPPGSFRPQPPLPRCNCGCVCVCRPAKLKRSKCC